MSEPSPRAREAAKATLLAMLKGAIPKEDHAEVEARYDELLEADEGIHELRDTLAPIIQRAIDAAREEEREKAMRLIRAGATLANVHLTTVASGESIYSREWDAARREIESGEGK